MCFQEAVDLFLTEKKMSEHTNLTSFCDEMLLNLVGHLSTCRVTTKF